VIRLEAVFRKGTGKKNPGQRGTSSMSKKNSNSSGVISGVDRRSMICEIFPDCPRELEVYNARMEE
jgi:hypothetical protein